MSLSEKKFQFCFGETVDEGDLIAERILSLKKLMDNHLITRGG